MSTRPLQRAFQAPPLTLLATEPIRALLDFCAGHLGHSPAAVGDGHPVIVYPGLGGGALMTSQLRNYLNACGFQAFDWDGGINTGPEGSIDGFLATLVQRVHETHRRHEGKVSLIGWSLGGVYAREIAKLLPGAVRQVITLATPFSALGEANHAGTLYRLLGGDTSRLTPELQARLRERPPVPTTSIYSKSDGVVCWRGCLERECDSAENVEVAASHLGIVTHPEVLRIVADRLAQPEGQWQRYRKPGTRAARRIKPRTTAPSPSTT